MTKKAVKPLISHGFTALYDGGIDGYSIMAGFSLSIFCFFNSIDECTYSLWQDMRDEVFSFYSKAKPERVPLSQQKEFKPVRNMVIREVVQMMEQLQSESVEYNVPQYAAPELKTPSENVSSDAEHNTPPRQEYRSPPPETVAACMVRMLHHMGNIFQNNVGASGYRGLQLDRKRRKELQEWKIALGHREDDHEDPANYPKMD